MRMKFTVYSNSVPATLCSLLGSGLMVGGLWCLFRAEFLNGVILLLLGIGLALLASWISDRSQFSAWKRKVKKSGLIPEIQRSVPVAIRVYQTNPCTQALTFIRTLNPQAAELIEQSRASRSGS